MRAGAGIRGRVKSPVSILLPTCYGAGLATGLAPFLAPWCTIGIGLLLIAARMPRPDLSLLAGSAVVGAASGWAAGRADRHSCRARLPTGRLALEVRVLEPVPGAGGTTLVRPLQGRCLGDVPAWFRSGPVNAGTVVAIQATWERDQRLASRATGLLRVQVATPASSMPSPGERFRNGLASTTARLYGDRAPLVDALVVGRRGGMDRDLRDAFAQSGLVHLLSISGFHVGVIVTWVVFLLRRAGVRLAPALALAAALATTYVAFLHWPAPAVRAMALAWALAWLRWRQRAPQPDALLATTALGVLLVDPWAIADLGAWLSVLSLWGAVRVARWARQAGGRHWAWQSAGSSVGATVATAPLTAMTLGAVAPIGIALNFVAIPIAAVAVPGVLASLALAPLLPGVAAALAAGSGLALHLLEQVAVWGARAPWGHLLVEPGVRAAVPWMGILGVLVWVTPRTGQVREAVARGLVALTGAMWAPLVAGALLPGPFLAGGTAGKLALHFVDVGQGDAVLISTPNGRQVLVDAGPRDARGDAGRTRILPLLDRSGSRGLDVLYLSHAHLDHVGGARSVLDAVPVGTVVEPAFPSADSVYLGLLDAVADAGAAWDAGRRGESLWIDSVRIDVLLPDTTWGGFGLDMNESSLVLLVQYRGFRALLAGDAGFAAESLLHGRVGRVDVLKVGHHGSRTSTGGAWLAELDPTVAVISAGRGNRYGHPAAETLARLVQQGVQVWRTDRDGTISTVTDGRTVEVRVRTRRETFPVSATPSP